MLFNPNTTTTCASCGQPAVFPSLRCENCRTIHNVTFEADARALDQEKRRGDEIPTYDTTNAVHAHTARHEIFGVLTAFAAWLRTPAGEFEVFYAERSR